MPVDPTPALPSPELLAILRCPLTLSPLRVEGQELVAEVGGLRYPIRDGFPVLLIEEAKVPPPFRNIEEFKRHFAPSAAKSANA
jgi:uncharacterized protein YbaR (Trm112 family)